MPRGVSIARGTAAICSRVELTFDLLARRPPPGQDFARLPHPTHNPNCKAAAGTRRPVARRTGVSPGIPCTSDAAGVWASPGHARPRRAGRRSGPPHTAPRAPQAMATSPSAPRPDTLMLADGCRACASGGEGRIDHLEHGGIPRGGPLPRQVEAVREEDAVPRRPGPRQRRRSPATSSPRARPAESRTAGSAPGPASRVIPAPTAPLNGRRGARRAGRRPGHPSASSGGSRSSRRRRWRR